MSKAVEKELDGPPSPDPRDCKGGQIKQIHEARPVRKRRLRNKTVEPAGVVKSRENQQPKSRRPFTMIYRG